MKKLLSMVLMLLCLVACSEDNEGTKDIILDSGTSTSQTIYADETSSAKGISFVANEAWTAVVNEIAVSKAEGRLDWITLSQYQGGAGRYTLNLSVQPNKTGADRKAEIVISCGNTEIKILIEQKSTTSEGEEVNPEVPQSTKMISEIVSYNKNEKGEYEKNSQITFKYDDKGRLIQQHHDFYSNEPHYEEEAKSWDYKLSYTKDAEGNDIVKSDCAVATFDGKNWVYTEILTLDASGKAVKWEDKAENGYHPSTYLFYYNDKNQHIRTERKGRQGDSDSNYTINATWGASDLLTGGEIPDFSSKTEISYNESILNDTSLDLAFTNITNSNFYEMRAEGFVFQSLGCWGTRIKNMPSKIVDKQNGNVDDTYIFEYQLDKDNRITSYTIKYDMGGDKVDIKYLQ